MRAGPDDPLGATSTSVFGISGQNIVGYYRDSSAAYHGFIYNGSTYTTLDDPLAGDGTYAFGVDGKNVVGVYYDASDVLHGFFYNGSTYKTLDDPLAGNGFEQGTSATGISGGDIVGHYADSSGLSHGFLFDGSTYTTLDDPLGRTILYGISGDSIVGSFGSHGFIATIPEPSAFTLLCVGAVVMTARRLIRKRTKSVNLVTP